jgi:hypothetical protein
MIQPHYICDLCESDIGHAYADALAWDWVPDDRGVDDMISMPAEDASCHLCPKCAEGIVRLYNETAVERAAEYERRAGRARAEADREIEKLRQATGAYSHNPAP